MKARYEQNIPALSMQGCHSLAQKKVCIIGCGGLGGYVTELLARAGVGRMTLVDPDVFEESNLNRQLFATEKNLGMYKVEAAIQRIAEVNSAVHVSAISSSFVEENAAELLKGHDVAVDALDNVASRLLLAKYCRKLSIPLVHGAVGGWCGQVSTILPEDSTMELLYQGDWEETDDTEQGSFTAAVAATASIQCAEVLKLLTGKGKLLSGCLLILDLLENEHTLLDLH